MASAQASVEERVERVAQLETGIKEDAKRLNDALTLLELAQDEEERVAFAAVMALSRLFLRWSRSGLLVVLDDPVRKKARVDAGVAEEQVRTWLHGQYTAYTRLLLELLGSERASAPLQLAALKVLTLFISKLVDAHLLVDLLRQLVRALLLAAALAPDVLAAFAALLVHVDVRFHTLRALADVIERYVSEPEGAERRAVAHARFCENAVVLLRAVPMPRDADTEHSYLVPPRATLAAQEDAVSTDPHSKKRPHSALQRDTDKVTQLSQHRKAYQRAWVALLRVEPALPEELRAHVLEHAHTLLVPHMAQPMLLLDWLSDAYARGGEDALRALHALFLLVTQHGLDYPQLYAQLYAQFTPAALASPLRLKLLRLSELCLKSPLLPTYLVACFVKKLLRLALTAAPDIIALVLHWAYNLFVIHPTIHYLVHKPAPASSTPASASGTLLLNEVVAQRSDPFLADAGLNEARESVAHTSAWELRALMMHHTPSVAQAAKLYKNHFGKRLFELKEDATAASFTAMFDLENSRKIKKGVPLAFEEPATLLKRDHFPGWALAKPTRKLKRTPDHEDDEDVDTA